MASAYSPEAQETPSVSLLAKPHCKPPSPFKVSYSVLVITTLISLASSSAFAYLLFSPTQTAFVDDTTVLSQPNENNIARPLKKLHHPTVILISSDGFRFGYQFKTPTPNIHRLIDHGTSADLGLIPVFPTITFPNHYSIATGLFPPYHGIVNNYFVDPETGDSFSTRRREAKWWLGEPLWETVANQGFGASVLYWPGGETQKGSWTCPAQFCPAYNVSTPFEDLVDKTLSYFDLPKKEIPIFNALYLREPDAQGHKYGPDHPEITKAVAKVDAALGRLIAGLEKRGVFDDVSIIFLGDHGMVATCATRYIYLEDLAPWIEIPSGWVQSQYELLGIQPPANVSAAEVVAKMNEGLSSGNVTNGDRLRVYLKEDLPARLRYSDSDRISPIIGLVEETYSVEVSRSQGKDCVGRHGYDNMLFSMRTVFVGHGPQFRRGRKVPSFMNVEVYNMVTSILKLKGAPNNGSDSFANSVILPPSA